jgi:hypothetical protein
MAGCRGREAVTASMISMIKPDTTTASGPTRQLPPQGGKCTRCPTPDAIACRGVDVRRFCELLDPACPQFNPGYVDVIMRESYRASQDMPPPPSHATGRGSPGACCGGNVPPGAYD